MGLTTQDFVGTIGLVAVNEPTKAPYAEFAVRLLAAMARAGVKPIDVVTELKVDKETVRLWTRGERMPTDRKLQKLAKMIGVDAGTLRYGSKDKGTAALPQLRGEHVTDEDELALLHAYRGLKKEWARTALRRRAVELLEEFGEPGTENPFKASRHSQ